MSLGVRQLSVRMSVYLPWWWQAKQLLAGCVNTSEFRTGRHSQSVRPGRSRIVTVFCSLRSEGESRSGLILDGDDQLSLLEESQWSQCSQWSLESLVCVGERTRVSLQ